MAVCVSAYSQHPSVAAAVGEVVGRVLAGMEPRPDFAVLVVSGRYVGAVNEIASAVGSLLAPEVLIGSDVPRVFGGSDDRASADGLLLLAGRLDDGSESVVPIRFDPTESPTAWQCLDRSPVEPGGVCLVLTEPSALAVRPPGLTVGIGASLGGGLLVDQEVGVAGGVGLRFPTEVATPFDFILPVWNDTTEEDWVVRGDIFDPGPGAGLVVLAARAAAAPMGSRFDFELVFDRFNGAVAGALAPVVFSTGPPASPRERDRAVCGLVIG